jgi:rhamnosyltransferase subunit B
LEEIMQTLSILVFAIGSHGDVLPMVAIGKMLRERGHRVSLVASSYFEPIVRHAGLNFISRGTSAEYIQRINHPDMWQGRKGIRLMFKRCRDYMRESYETVLSASVRGQTVVVAPFSVFGARIAQEKLRIPLVTVHLQPVLIRSARSHSARPLGRLLTPVIGPMQQLYQMAADRLLVDSIVLPKMNSFRNELGFPRISRPMNGWIHSPKLTIGLFPDWFAPPQPDWPPQVRLTGFPLYDEDQSTESYPELTEFLNVGDAPIVFTLGTAMLAAREFFSESVRVCQLLGRRGIFLTQFSEQIPPLPQYIRHFKYVPFKLLLSRTAALVHHAGIGTIAQALRAGIPQLLVPCNYDQPDNSVRSKELGVADSIHITRYSAPIAGRKIRHLLSSAEVASRCKAVASKFAGTDPLAQTCELIESITEQDR